MTSVAGREKANNVNENASIIKSIKMRTDFFILLNIITFIYMIDKRKRVIDETDIYSDISGAPVIPEKTYL